MKFSHVTLGQRFALALQTRDTTYVCRFITAYFPRDNMCYVKANEIPRARGKSTTVTRRSLPLAERLARETIYRVDLSRLCMYNIIL